MNEHHVDVVVVGLGPGGEDLAGRLAESGLRVVGVERDLLGGECPYYGCVPSKMLIRAANLLQGVRRANTLAGPSTTIPNYALVADRICNEATHDWTDDDAVSRFTGKGGIFVRGTATFDGPGRVVVDDNVYIASTGVVIATGTSPMLPPVDGLVEAKPWTNRDIFKIRTNPTSLTVIGGGAIGVELAQAFSRFGTKVTVVEGAERILSEEEPESSALLTGVLQREGVTIRCGVKASSVSRKSGVVTTTLEDGSTVTSAEILVVAGRRLNLQGIGLATLGLDETLAEPLTTDARMRVVGVSKLWAIGDITGRGAYTHMATYEAAIAGDDITGAVEPRTGEAHAVPRVTFTDPEIGSVGLSESQARAQGIDVAIGYADSIAENRNWIYGDGNEGFLKLIMDRQSNFLVGATCVGPRGGDVLSMFNLAVHARTPVPLLRTMICAFPTFYRAAIEGLAAIK